MFGASHGRRGGHLVASLVVAFALTPFGSEAIRPSCKGPLCSSSSLAGHTSRQIFPVGSCGGRGCASYREGASCQCNVQCMTFNNCCADFARRCLTDGNRENRSVGVEPTEALLWRFWATTIIILVVGATSIAWYAGLLNGVSSVPVPGAAAPNRLVEEIGKPVGEDYSIDTSWSRVRFRSPKLEAKYDSYIVPRRIKLAAMTLACVVVLHSCLMVYLEPKRQRSSCYDLSPAIATAQYVFVAVLGVASVYCSFRPNERLFAFLLAALYLYLPAARLPPLHISCYYLKVKCSDEVVTDPVINEAYRHCDCSLQGQGSLQALMTMLFIHPWLSVRFEYMHSMWLWIFGVYLAMTFLYIAFTREDIFQPSDITHSVVLLSIALMIATRARHHHELDQRRDFVEDLKQRHSSRKIFLILEYMMPAHVIRPMLQNPQAHLADQISRVSILFILIADFDSFTRAMTPSQLLKFLNEQFTKMDYTCQIHKVTKIETVGEEYVACVGVTPEDKKLNEAEGHGVLLERLFNAGAGILRCQSDSVLFKIGVHTGQIVAGVIGTKLPRYRLFGDTINSAARMMQKGIAGQMQFGTETFRDLPSQLKEKVKGPRNVELKGKGVVEAYTFAPPKVATNADDYSAASGEHMRGRDSLGKVFFGAQQVEGRITDHSRFDAALEAVRADEAGTGSWFLSERTGFTEEMDEEWKATFHQECVLKSLHLKFGRFCITVLVLTAFELAFLLKWRVWHYPHQVYSRHMRWIIFVYTRGIVIGMGMLWWFAAESQKWMKKRPRKTQIALFITACITTLLMYISYDALCTSQSIVYRKLSTNHFHAPQDQTLTLNFFIFFCVYMRMHQLPFCLSVGFLPLMMAILGLHRWFHILFPQFVFKGRAVEPPFSVEALLVLLIQVCINIAIAYELEQSSRRRFKTQRAVKLTEERTTYILDALLPPLVVEEICKLPANAAPSHQYRHATIAQSDLRGFTKLASTKEPTEVVQFMTELFGSFDVLTDKHGVYKVETVGDAYIAGMAEKPLTPTNSPVAVVLFGLDMVRAVEKWAKDLGVEVACRVGVHYGECIGGIVGSEMQRYHLFGDFLTCLEILESTSVEGGVQVSGACKAEVERQLRDAPGASSEKLAFVERDCAQLQTSKGETHEFSEVGGKTFLTESDHP